MWFSRLDRPTGIWARHLATGRGAGAARDVDRRGSGGGMGPDGGAADGLRGMLMTVDGAPPGIYVRAVGNTRRLQADADALPHTWSRNQRRWCRRRARRTEACTRSLRVAAIPVVAPRLSGGIWLHPTRPEPRHAADGGRVNGRSDGKSEYLDALKKPSAKPWWGVGPAPHLEWPGVTIEIPCRYVSIAAAGNRRMGGIIRSRPRPMRRSISSRLSPITSGISGPAVRAPAVSGQAADASALRLEAHRGQSAALSPA